jgi:hypothetical protein
MTDFAVVYVLRTLNDGQPVGYYRFLLEQGDVMPPWVFHGHHLMVSTTAADAAVEFATEVEIDEGRAK